MDRHQASSFLFSYAKRTVIMATAMTVAENNECDFGWFFCVVVVKDGKRGVFCKYQETQGRGISYVIASPYSADDGHTF